MKPLFLTCILALFLDTTFGQEQKIITQKQQLVIDTEIQFKHFDDVQVYQYLKNMVFDKKITYSQKYDSSGRLIAEYFKDYKTDSGNGRGYILVINEYDDAGKLKITTNYYETFTPSVVQKIFFYYNDSLLATKESFEFTTRLKPDLNKGIGRQGGCIITPDDYEKDKTWKLTDLTKYEYDNKGKKIKAYSLVGRFPSDNDDYEYEYNKEGKLLKEKLLKHKEALWTTEYRYMQHQEISLLTWNINNWGTTKTIKKYGSKAQNLLEETTIQNGKKFVRKYYYDHKKRLVRYNSYDSDGKLDLTHVYKYKKTPRNWCLPKSNLMQYE
jgi:hypothetical protein